MRIPLYQIDAFADRPFSGNPAAVCPLDSWLDDDVMQNMAMENNLSETAFFVGADGKYDLRWFTPASEVDLCGHATLASAHVVFNRLETTQDKIVFSTKSGDLVVTRQGDLIEMDFPARAPEAMKENPALLAALGGNPTSAQVSRDFFVTYETEAEVAALTPDMAALASLENWAIIVTAPGDHCDFVSRFFAPGHGIDEDPVTGSAHCTLIPYWSDRLGKDQMIARQISARGGELHCRNQGDRVAIAGRAHEVLVGEFLL
ncbi:MAG: PhzF family phenazine biosynthesis protein [Alphaproteobacteria bacterium]|jgi:PhzF family phenazine biosynthesis protein|nr:PhzF family phenazine biosynthesis protein [Alphaproteobacteria bacterium]MBT4086002.1 PhzF family phenazine biosynthesis protein [Alphaproteobacteria bacterium]MBT4546552.1 PhzF family phenazine biosynthesis protein [Alphaproteobacteria bacterium]MBT7745969.1 PhzF family phenazine biosynthesis protein [Alphaproteobacteria bacterium]